MASILDNTEQARTLRVLASLKFKFKMRLRGGRRNQKSKFKTWSREKRGGSREFGCRLWDDECLFKRQPGHCIDSPGPRQKRERDETLKNALPEVFDQNAGRTITGGKKEDEDPISGVETGGLDDL